VLDDEAERALPRLSRVFELVRGRMGIYVELKGDGTGAALGDLIRRGAADGVRLIAGSAVPDLVRDVGELAPEVPRSILFTPGWRTRDMIAACRELGATYAHPCFRPIDAALVDEVHRAGLRVMTPHTNDAAEACFFAEIGVNVIASDDPRILVPLRAC
jgi:glycerophosphoryl diester phosphodiesterase